MYSKTQEPSFCSNKPNIDKIINLRTRKIDNVIIKTIVSLLQKLSPKRHTQQSGDQQLIQAT